MGLGKRLRFKLMVYTYILYYLSYLTSQSLFSWTSRMWIVKLAL